MRKLKLFFIIICMALILGILGLFKLNYVYAEGDSADFSSANYSVTSEFPKVILSITGIQNKSEGKPYYYKITGSTEQPKTEYTTNEEITKDGWQNLVIDGEGKVSGENIANYVELNQDLYLWVLEYDGSGEVKGKVVVNAKKLERPDVPEYTQVFSSNTHLTHSTTQLSSI